MNALIEKANILCEALPYINKLSGKTIVIKYGGNAMQNEEVISTIMQDVAMLKIVGVNPVLVHGGGPEINNMLKKLQIPSEFHNGLRITSAQTMEVVQMVLCGKINKDLTSRITCLGVKAIGLSGKDGGLISVKKHVPADGVDLGFVGDITAINADMIKKMCASGYIPVIAGIGADKEGNSYNINADTVASEVAAAMQAEKLIFMTDIDGIRRDEKDAKSLISVVSAAEIRQLIADGIVSGGMIPKVNACVAAINAGVKNVHIINGTIHHPILLEIFTDKGIGTMINA